MTAKSAHLLMYAINTITLINLHKPTETNIAIIITESNS